MPSNAYLLFNRSTFREVGSLISIFRERNAGRGPNTDYGLLHGGLILLCSGWEAYCEDVSREAARKIKNQEEIKFTNMPESIQRKILKFSWPENLKNNDPLNTRLFKLPEDGWKKLIEEMLDDYLRDFNTPKFSRERGKNLKDLLEMYLSDNPIPSMQRLTRDNDITMEVDKVVSIRGDIAHRGKPTGNDAFNAGGLNEYLKLIQKTCAAIDCIIWTEFRDKYDITPWRMTRSVTSHLAGFNQPQEEVA